MTIVFAHGGGFSWGTLDDYNRICRNLCGATGGDVVSVDYRLAPSHPFPSGLDDLCCVLVEVIDAVPPNHTIIVAGDSAGGCLAAGAAQRLTGQGRQISGQLLIYPMMEYHDRTPLEFHTLSDRFHPSFDAVRNAWTTYLQAPPDRLPPFAVPTRAENLTGLPPALTIVAENDPLRFEAIAYTDLLLQAGVPSAIKSYKGTQHGFLNEDAGPEIAAALSDIAQWLWGIEKTPRVQLGSP